MNIVKWFLSAFSKKIAISKLKFLLIIPVIAILISSFNLRLNYDNDRFTFLVEKNGQTLNEIIFVLIFILILFIIDMIYEIMKIKYNSRVDNRIELMEKDKKILTFYIKRYMEEE